jgi:group I intron endonuclease
MIGIYKITNPNGKVYIGQSVDIEKRWKHHKWAFEGDKYQYHLYNSFKKYGFDDHRFEIIEECEEAELNTKERYYQDKYNSITEGLNSRYTKSDDKSGRLSEKTLEKLSKIRKGRVAPNKGKPMPEHQRQAQIGRKLSNETKKKISKSNKRAWGNKPIEEVKAHNKRHSERMTGEGNPMYGRATGTSMKVVIDGVEYRSIRQASIQTGISWGKIKRYHL